MWDRGQVAQQLLDEVGITAPPIPVHEIAQHLGLRVVIVDKHYMRTFAGGGEMPADGLLLRDCMTIAINGDHPPTRQRFSLAHELGEYLSARTGPTGPLLSLSGSYRNRIHEREMQRFAAMLLMPHDMVLREWQRWADTRRAGRAPRFSDCCYRFGVSKRAMNLRVREILGVTRLEDWRQ